MDLMPKTATDPPPELDGTGLFDARYTAFLETITHLRPRLHRSSYLAEYKRYAGAWRLALGTVDGETVALLLRHTAEGWVPQAIKRF